jgi:hypothetical protein
MTSCDHLTGHCSGLPSAVAELERSLNERSRSPAIMNFLTLSVAALSILLSAGGI